MIDNDSKKNLPHNAVLPHNATSSEGALPLLPQDVKNNAKLSKEKNECDKESVKDSQVNSKMCSQNNATKSSSETKDFITESMKTEFLNKLKKNLENDAGSPLASNQNETSVNEKSSVVSDSTDIRPPENLKKLKKIKDKNKIVIVTTPQLKSLLKLGNSKSNRVSKEISPKINQYFIEIILPEFLDTVEYKDEKLFFTELEMTETKFLPSTKFNTLALDFFNTKYPDFKIKFNKEK